MLDLLAKPGVNELIISILGMILTYVFSKVGKNIIKDQNKKAAQEIIMSAVDALGEKAKTWKAQNADNKLTPGQKEFLETNAIANAQEIGLDAGINILKTLGPDLAKLAVTTAVKALKSRQTPQLPANVLKVLPFLILFCVLTGCSTSVPAGWTTTDLNNVTVLRDEIYPTVTDSYLSTLGYIAASCYEAAGTSGMDKNLRMLFAIQTTNEFAKKIKPVCIPIKELRASYINSNQYTDAELWVAFISYQVLLHRGERQSSSSSSDVPQSIGV